jgi:hypothetical protein
MNSSGVDVCITTPSQFNHRHVIGKIVPPPFKKPLRRFVYYINPGYPHANPHTCEYTPGPLRQLFEQNGFRVGRIMGGTLRVPVWFLFERVPLLLMIWKCLGKIIDHLPWGIHLKQNVVMEMMQL